MRIRTQKDIEKLDLKIKEELGVDVQKYRNQEVVANFVDLLVFPKYVVSWGIRPIIISIIIFILGFFFIDLVHIEYLIYALIGLVLFLATGILTGVLFLIWKMKSDIWGIVDYSLDIMKYAVTDLSQVNNQITADNRSSVLGLLFKGIIHIVTIPMISNVISDKVPVVGTLVNSVVKRILRLVSDKVNFDDDIQQELDQEETESNIIQIYSNAITSVSDGLEKIVNFTFRIAQLPFKIVFTIIVLILISFIYVLN